MASTVFRLLPLHARSSLGLNRGAIYLHKEGAAAQQLTMGRCLIRFQGTSSKLQGTSSKLHESTERDSKPISKFPIPDRETLPQNIQRVMSEVEKQSGFLPNIFKLMSYDPESFEFFFGYYNLLISDRGNLTKEDKELITLAISTENKCVYCTVSHRPVFRMLSNNPCLTDQMSVNWQSADLSDRQRAIIEVAIAVTKNQPISEEHFSNLEAHGLDQWDAFNIGHFSSFFALANRVAIFTQLRPNEEFSMLD